MSELVPDSWRLAEDDTSTKCCHQPRRASRRTLVTDILLWLECYSTLATVITTRYPDKCAELWAYQATIIKAHRDVEGDAWVTYDMCYRRQAANSKSLDWSQIDFTLYNQTFAGKARIKHRCGWCLSEYHPTHNCDFAPDNMATRHPQWGRTLKPPADSMRPSRTPFRQPQQDSIEVCNLFNTDRGNICRYPRCRYAHVCAFRWCRGPHPKSECPGKKADIQVRKRARSPNAIQPLLPKPGAR